MGKEIKSGLDEKRSKIMSASIQRGVDIYLAENIDKFGYGHVTFVEISGDLKSAWVYVNFEDKERSDESLMTLNGSRREVSNIIKELIKTRYFPKVNFQKGEDEDLVI